MKTAALPLLLEAVAASLGSLSPKHGVKRPPQSAGEDTSEQPPPSPSPDDLFKQADALIDMRAPLVWQVHQLTKEQVCRHFSTAAPALIDHLLAS